MRLVKNFLIRLLVFFLRKKPHPHFPDRPKILIATTTGLGDSLWGTPSFSALRKKFPFAHIGILTNALGKELFQNNPDVDAIYSYKGPLFFHFFSLRKKLIEKGYFAALLFHSSERLVLPLLASIGAQKIIGTRGLQKGLDDLFTTITEKETHEIDRRGKIIEALGAKIEDFSLRYFPEFDEKKEAKEFVQKLFPGETPFIIFHPGAKDSYKCWSIQNYIRLGNLLKEALPVNILIGAGPGEELRAEKIASEIQGAKLLNPPRPVRKYAALLDAADLVITNDTGPMHLACALEKPVIAFFAPTRKKTCGPYNVKTANAIEKPRTCTPCLQRKCLDPFCLRQISPKEIFEEVMKVLKKK